MGVSGVVETGWGLELTTEGLSVGGMDRGEGEVNLKGFIAFIENHLGIGPRTLPTARLKYYFQKYWEQFHLSQNSGQDFLAPIKMRLDTQNDHSNRYNR